jgi:Lysyl oxidase
VRPRAILAAGVAVASCSACAGVVLAGGRAAAPDALGPASRLPDLVQELPTAVEVTSAGSARGPAWRLGFRSAVGNVGDGPLRIVAGRASASAREMSADQEVDRADGPPLRIGGVGRLRYVHSADHQHWHLLGFERYELRRADHTVLVRDRKTGFCLGDRYGMRLALPVKPDRPVYESRCGLGRPELLALEQGISAGYGDDYPPNLEGQWLRLDGLPDGRYVLVHRVDVEGRLRERTRSNNAASLLLSLRWRDGRPLVRTLERCPGSERCPPA